MCKQLYAETVQCQEPTHRFLVMFSAFVFSFPCASSRESDVNFRRCLVNESLYETSRTERYLLVIFRDIRGSFLDLPPPSGTTGDEVIKTTKRIRFFFFFSKQTSYNAPVGLLRSPVINARAGSRLHLLACILMLRGLTTTALALLNARRRVSFEGFES